MNLRELVENQAKKYKDKVFLYWKDITISYSQLNELTNRVANFYRYLLYCIDFDLIETDHTEP